MKKKFLLVAAALTGLLASCGPTSIVVDDGYYGNGGGRSSSLSLNSLTNYKTNWQLSQDVTDVNTGRVLNAGTYVICDNTTTQLSFDINWTGYLKAVGLELRGYNSDAYKDIGVYNVSSNYGSTGVEYNVGSGLAPLSLSHQSITVNPVNNVNIKGYTYARAQGIDANGYVSNIVTTSYTIPVVDCR